MSSKGSSFHRLSVIVPVNPFAPDGLGQKRHCLCALDVEQLMDWWPGRPHAPHRDARKVKAIQRSLDWKRVVQIAAYLLQEEITGVPEKIDKYFQEIYEPTKNEPGREWPPNVTKVVGYEKSGFPVFSNVLIHVNGARIEAVRLDNEAVGDAANLVFNENAADLNFSVIDGQHRINGAYLAIKLLQENNNSAKWQIPAEIFLDLDPVGAPPRHQAQIFIDVNFYQKKVDRSLVADLFPTARGTKAPSNTLERAQDIGRKLMLEVGPLVGMVQIPGIKYGVKDVITLATLNSAIEDTIPILEKQGIESLQDQTDFIAQCLSAWFEASGRFESHKKARSLSPENVAYQGRVLVSILTLIPALVWELKKDDVSYISRKAESILTKKLRTIASRANLLESGAFIGKSKFREHEFLGSGGIGRFRDSLWAVVRGDKKLRKNARAERTAAIAEENRAFVHKSLAGK